MTVDREQLRALAEQGNVWTWELVTASDGMQATMQTDVSPMVLALDDALTAAERERDEALVVISELRVTEQARRLLVAEAALAAAREERDWLVTHVEQLQTRVTTAEADLRAAREALREMMKAADQYYELGLSTPLERAHRKAAAVLAAGDGGVLDRPRSGAASSLRDGARGAGETVSSTGLGLSKATTGQKLIEPTGDYGADGLRKDWPR